MKPRNSRPAAWSLLACLAGCVPPDSLPGVAGDPSRGRLLLEQYDCGSCHVIPGVRRARGVQGPNLEAYAHRAYIAGELPNEPDVLVRWIQDPPALVPGTTMPDRGVPAPLARDMAAFLMSLR